MLVPAASFAGVLISVNIAPPALPVYTQPLCPGEGYIWTPGYWGWRNGAYIFHAGYWGPHIGFYGGVNYGFGYTGVGYEGGYWNHGVFAYNRSVNNINIVNVHNVYTKTVIVNNYNRVSYNGGTGGIRAQESAQERAAFHEQHFQGTVNQQNHEQFARQDRTQLASVNNGRPQMAAARTPEAYHSFVQQRGGSFNNNQRPALQQNAPQAHPQAQAYSQQSHPQPQNRPQPQNHEQPREQPHGQPQEHHEGGGEHGHPEGHEGKGGR